MGFAGILKQSTAVDVLIGPFVSATDGDTEMTALTISQGDVLLSKNGQTGAQKNDNTAAAHDADGMYNCELDATDTDTVGQLTLWVHEATSLLVRHDFQVVEEVIYDALFAASATGALPVSTGGIVAGSFGAGAIDAAAIATNAITSNELADGAITAAKFGAGAIDATAIANGAIDAATFAAGAIDATAIAANAIGASELAADAVDEILDEVVEGTLTLRQAIRVIVAACAGKLSGAATTTVVIRDTTDAKDRVTATVDADGNRSAVTLDVS